MTRDGEIRSNVIASQGLLHARYGGVVPEIASRHHLELLDAVIADALERAGVTLDDVERGRRHARAGADRRAAGGRLVGQGAGGARAAAARRRWTTCTATSWPARSATDPIEPPYLCLVASGGHTFLARVDDPSAYRVLGQTLDDAAGEAFDKGARLLGLGYPGGPELDRLARERRSRGVRLPALGARRRPRLQLQRAQDGAALPLRDRAGRRPRRPRRLLPAGDRRRAASPALEQALEREGLERLAIGGGVAANSRAARGASGALGVPVWVPPLELCTDNAAMIAAAARFLEPIPYPDYLDLDAGQARPVTQRRPLRQARLPPVRGGPTRCCTPVRRERDVRPRRRWT